MIAKLAILLIRVYQLTLSPLLGPVCRFTPSCSRYTVTCLERFGFLRGSWLGIKRIARCHPWHPGGYDPPPLPKGSSPELGEAFERSASEEEAQPASLPAGDSSIASGQARQSRHPR